MAIISRRDFLKGAAAAGGATVLSGGPFAGLIAGAGSADIDLGPLGPVADARDGKVRLWLPNGFSYRSFHDTDVPDPIILDDGTRLPGRHDGMAAFPAPDGNVWLVRNHEVNGTSATGVAFGPGTPYDSKALGGTTTCLVTPFGEVLEAWTSLNGTQMNCAGGAMPWGSYISCQETVNGPDVYDDFTRNTPTPSPPTTYISNARLQKPHGFMFEVPAGGQSNRQPIMHAGRFAHEAAVFCPDDGAVYITEDNFAFPSGFYRYIPPSDPLAVGQLEDGGRLEMLKVVGVNEAHLEGHQVNGATYAVEWVEIENPIPSSDGLFPTSGGLPTVTNDQALVFVGNQGRALGAAGFSRLEGTAYSRGQIYFTATQGGGLQETEFQDDVGGYGNGTGQVWAYRPADQTLTCVFQSPGSSTLDLPDNMTTSRRGTLILCEDGPVDNYIRGLSRRGQLFDIALNRLRRNAEPFATRFAEEFAGSTFNNSGRTLFVNIQAAQGISFAIWGNWQGEGI